MIELPFHFHLFVKVCLIASCHVRRDRQPVALPFKPFNALVNGPHKYVVITSNGRAELLLCDSFSRSPGESRVAAVRSATTMKRQQRRQIPPLFAGDLHQSKQ